MSIIFNYYFKSSGFCWKSASPAQRIKLNLWKLKGEYSLEKSKYAKVSLSLMESESKLTVLRDELKRLNSLSKERVTRFNDKHALNLMKIDQPSSLMEDLGNSILKILQFTVIKWSQFKEILEDVDNFVKLLVSYDVRLMDTECYELLSSMQKKHNFNINDNKFSDINEETGNLIFWVILRFGEREILDEIVNLEMKLVEISFEKTEQYLNFKEKERKIEELTGRCARLGEYVAKTEGNIEDITLSLNGKLRTQHLKLKKSCADVENMIREDLKDLLLNQKPQIMLDNLCYNALFSNTLQEELKGIMLAKKLSFTQNLEEALSNFSGSDSKNPTDRSHYTMSQNGRHLAMTSQTSPLITKDNNKLDNQDFSSANTFKLKVDNSGSLIKDESFYRKRSSSEKVSKSKLAVKQLKKIKREHIQKLEDTRKNGKKKSLCCVACI